MVFLILLVLLFPINEGTNITYIVKKDKNNILPSCIAEEFERYEAIGWIYPLPIDEQGIPNITTKFIPSLNNNFNCNFFKNNICTKRWGLRNWDIDDSSTRTKEFIEDYRWEELPPILITNYTKEFKERIEVNKVFRSGVSIRAKGAIELLVCSGWNPYNHPCYHFNIDSREIYLNKYPVLPKQLDIFKHAYLQQYKSFSNILAHDEWRNFVVSFDENQTIKLFDINLNRTIIEYKDDINFSPLYLLMRSNDSSLWKFHQSEFLYTNTTQISRLGPQLTLFSKDLCISLLVSICDKCEMIFFYQNFTTRKILKHVGPMQNHQWMEIKLKEGNVQFEHLNLFVETKFTENDLNQTGFWAIDNVRVCNENEVKVSYLKLNNKMITSENEDYISCQLVRIPSWRPKKLIYNQIKDLSETTTESNSTSIKLTWAQEDIRNDINYFIQYQANDHCSMEPHNLKRLRSSGFLTTKYNEVIINNLVPFTLYNVTISTVLHEVDKKIYIHTLETDEATLEELPQAIQLRPSESALYVSWQKVPCTAVYGRIIYTLVISNKKLNFTKKLALKIENSYKIDGLQPFTAYSLSIITARNGANIYNGLHTHTLSFNFTTLAGVASAIENLELYSIDQNSASLRYSLPKKSNGVPKEIQLIRCNTLSFGKCKSYVSTIKSCPLWPNKFCVYVNNLIPFNKYSFRLSVKNLNTDQFGKEVSVTGYTADRVPGAPINVTYKTVDCDATTDYCHLNITWFHPYYENGTITAFNIICNSTTEEDIYIHEVYTVENKSYSRYYTYQIKYVPYSAQYKLQLQSQNGVHKSNFTELLVNTDNIGDHIDQSFKLLEKHHDRLIFKTPVLDYRLNYYVLTVVVQDFETKKAVDGDLLKNKLVGENLCHNFGNTWISRIEKIENNNTETIMIDKSKNGSIKPKTKYCITFIITNNYKNMEHNVIYYEKLETPDAPPTKEVKSSINNNHLYVLLLLLLLIPIGFFIYRYLRKRRVIQKPQENNENIYESLPFDECENNCVNNDNYDQLLHK